MMKNKLMRSFALCLLLVLLVGASLPGQAAAKPSIITSTLWAGIGRCAVIVQNLPSDATSFSITSSNKAVIKAGCDDKKDANSLWVEPLKVGKSKITVKYRSGGKTRSVSTTFQVKKYPNPLAWVKINGKKISLSKNKLGYDCNNYKKTSITVDFKVSDGWKVQYLDGVRIRDDEYRDFKWKKGKAIKLAADQRAIIDIALINNKTGDEFFYMIFVDR